MSQKSQEVNYATYQSYHCGTNNNWTIANRIDYWKRNSGYEMPTHCPDCGCIPSGDNDWVGAHVRKVNESNGPVYITPTCRKCNSQGATEKHQFETFSEYLVSIKQ